MNSAAIRPGDAAAERRAAWQGRGPGLHIASSPIVGRHLITLAGPIDTAGAVILATVLRRACVPGRRVVVDLAAVTFLAEAGLRVLLEARSRLAAGGGEFVLSGASPRIRRFLQITGYDRVLKMQPREARALADGSAAALPHDWRRA